MSRLKRYLFLLLLVLGGYLSSHAQNGDKEIDGKNIDEHLLSSLFLKKLNDLRTSQGLNNLKADSILAMAANDQAKYMLKTGVVGHTQTTKNKTSPTQRVIFYKGTNDRVGENCIQIALGVPYRNKKNVVITVKTYEEAAEALFQGWKNSKPHYHNMITPYYDNEGLGYSYDEKTHFLYSTEVFGTAAYVPPKGFKVVDDAWGVGDGPKGSNFFSNDLANFVERHGDSIYFYYSNLPYFKEFVNGPDDGLAIDIVAREQFNCAHNNNLHGSPVFDGWMLKPVYYKKLMGGNQYGPKSGEIYTCIAAIPAGLKNRDIQYNVIYIKNKKSNGYSYPIMVDAENLQMLRLATYWDTIHRSVTADTFNVKINHYVEFKRGISNLNKNQIQQLEKRVLQYKKYIKSVEIKTFSSVEGRTEINLKLQKERAENIKTTLSKLISNTVEWQLDEKENWEAFYNQIEGTRYAHLKDLGKNVIKLKLYDPVLLDSLDAFLSQERTAIIIFHLNGNYKDDIEAEGISRIALQDAIQKGDSLKAWTIQSKMIGYYEKGKMPLEDIVDNDVPVIPKFLPLLANTVAAKASDISYMYDPKFKKLVKDVFAIGKNYAPLKLSYCVCAINYLSARTDTLIDNKKVENYLDQCVKNHSLANSIWKYYLDYYVASAYYYWSNHKFGKLDTALEGIKTYYPKVILSDTDYIKLGKLFNMYYRSKWTIDMLYPVVKKGTSDEDLLFLFVTTAPLYLNTVPQQEYIKYMMQARAMNKERFCAWVNNYNWQLLRNDDIKKLFCEQCKCTP